MRRVPEGATLPEQVFERKCGDPLCVMIHVLVFWGCQNDKERLKSRMKPSFFFIYLIYIVYKVCSVPVKK